MAAGLVDVGRTPRTIYSSRFAVEVQRLESSFTGADLWCLRGDSVARELRAEPRELGWLTDEELARHARFHFQRDKDLYLAKRLLVRGVLSEYVERAPETWRFVAGEHGRPAIVPACGAGDLQFNLSSSAGLAVCAVGRDGLLGVDVEDLARPVKQEFLEGVLAEAERERLMLLPEARRGCGFLRCWTLKEAYVKARGLGLTLPLVDAVFDYDDAAGIAVRFEGEIADDPARWRFGQMRVMERYVVAVAWGRE